VPEGYEVVDGECTQVFVANETKDVIFTVVETSSPEPNMKATIKAKHKGKVKKVDIDMPGKRSKKYLEKRKNEKAKPASSNSGKGGALALAMMSTLIFSFKGRTRRGGWKK
jgi:hypothetical protein